MLLGVRFPLDFREVGLPAAIDCHGVTIWCGPTALAWSGPAPSLEIESAVPPAAVVAEGWSIDHVVVTTPDLEGTVTALQERDADLRRRGEVRRRPAAFLFSSSLLEVVEVPGRPVRLWGLALATSEDLTDVVDRWRDSGWAAGDPRDAIQAGRRIFTVAGTTLAVMSART